MKFLLLLFSILILLSCSNEDNDNFEHTGEKGYSCYENFTCNEGLLCNDEKTCVEENTECTPKSCLELNAQCGNTDDGCGKIINCGNCEFGKSCNEETNKCEEKCIPKTCNDFDAQCGRIDDGCNGSVYCGTCGSNEQCVDNQCICNELTCSEVNAQCGDIDNGCGNLINCGTCPENKVCNSVTHQCEETCIPKTCSEIGAECGITDNGCGENLNCGNCTNGKVCNDNNKCVPSCIPNCDYKECGSDGCGGNCGTCGQYQECNNFTCITTCTPKTCSDLGASCGNINNGCGETLNCGTCSEGKTCLNSICIEQESPYQLIKDRHFRKGFNVRSPNYPGDIIGSLIPGFESGNPIWTLGQWASFTDLDNFPKTVTPDGYVYWQDNYKKVTIGNENNIDLSFKVNAYNEYGGIYYQHGNSPGRTTWVHLLGEQQITDPYHQENGCPPLSELSSLKFSIRARLLYDNRNLRNGYDSNKHAAQYLVYFTIQNLNINSPGFGDYLWFGLTIHDDRGPRVVIQGDDFTQKLIYNIGFDILNDYSNAPITDNQWHRLEEDLLPHILNALQEAWNRGYLADSHNLSDYKIGGMNIGWEITGLNDTEMQIDDLSLIYQRNNGGNNINECQNGTAQCDENATCTDTPENYTCTCNPGFTGNGFTCTPITVNEIRYDFNTNGNKEGWTTVNMTDLTQGGPNNGLWIMTVPGNDPMMISPDLDINAETYSKIEIRMANDHNPANTSVLQVFWSRMDSSGFSESKSRLLGISNGGGWETYTIDLSSSDQWRGTINKIRIDPILSGDGHAIGIDYILIK